MRLADGRERSIPLGQMVAWSQPSVASTKLSPPSRLTAMAPSRPASTTAPAAEIVAAARDEQVDLIIMATHGRSGLKHLVGSVTEKVVRLATRPVLVTHYGRNEEPVEAGAGLATAV